MRRRYKKSRKINKGAIAIFVICFSIFIICGVKMGEVLAYKMMERDKEDTTVTEEKKIKDAHKKQKEKTEKSSLKANIEVVDDNETNKDKPVETKKAEPEEKKEEVVKKEENTEKENEEPKKSKVAYLTFDDGPSKQVTPQVLDILKKYNIKATFFVIGSSAEYNSDLLKRAYAEGHAIGNHTYSHNYKYIYSSVDNFLADIHKNEQVLKNILGQDFKTNLVRFPGGSFGKKKDPFKTALKNQGYNYFDWNALNGDAEGHHIPKDRLVQKLKTTSSGKNELIILMHDLGTKQTTVDALPEIIEYLQSEGYEFRKLN